MAARSRYPLPGPPLKSQRMPSLVYLERSVPRASRRTILLDDGEFLIAEVERESPRFQSVFLERRCAITEATPRGRECIGTGFVGAGGTWSARVATAFDVRAGTDAQTVATGVDRLDAIVALWHARRRASLTEPGRPGGC